MRNLLVGNINGQLEQRGLLAPLDHGERRALGLGR
ncbi:unannotated protein [freshwater metagenome]|uniref:Unannotated protein n=1 Tax=freshwater metagenome TaxID=449393 RepID=A0A6J7FBF6_9ZZZZ